MRKNKKLSKEGATALLVSHDLNMIEKYCNRVIWLEQGKIIKEGETKEVVGEYKKPKSLNTCYSKIIRY